MRVNIYYGGRGLIEDSTIYVINKAAEVLKELRVDVEVYNLYEQKKSIASLPKTAKGVDGVILATHVEWFGIGGLMQQFLDACWLYGDKEEISTKYMMPIVIASTYGERDAECTLIKAWELLGGIPVTGLCAYVEDHVAFETNSGISRQIEKMTENFYRSISQRSAAMPNSADEVSKKVSKAKALKLTPQESEQLSEYVSNDQYVKKQKEDIEELTMMFKGMLGEDTEDGNYIDRLKNAYIGSADVNNADYLIVLTDLSKELHVKISDGRLECVYGNAADVDVIVKMTSAVFDKIIENGHSFQEAFMTGELTAKGNFNILRLLDACFRF